MKADLATAVISAIVGVLLAYFLTSGLILQDPKPVTIKTLNNSVSTNLDEPSVEVFNYRALNPTVEVYIDCSNYDADGSCVEGTGE